MKKSHKQQDTFSLAHFEIMPDNNYNGGSDGMEEMLRQITVMNNVKCRSYVEMKAGNRLVWRTTANCGMTTLEEDNKYKQSAYWN